MPARSLRSAFLSFILTLTALGGALGLVAPAMAVQPDRILVIARDFGGKLQERVVLLALMRNETDTIHITGVCASACTLALRTDYNYDVCVGPNARLGFHKPYMPDKNGNPGTGQDFTERADRTWKENFLDYFPADLREHLEAQYIPSAAHGDSIVDSYWLEGEELLQFIPRCQITVIGSN